MTGNEIIKALECCSKNILCGQCPLNGKSSCMNKLSACALDLITRKQEEIERLQKYNTEVAYKHYNDGIKEFAEMLKEKAYIFESGFEANEDRIVKIVALKDIDNLLKEMVGDTE